MAITALSFEEAVYQQYQAACDGKTADLQSLLKKRQSWTVS
jgi:hypothetical protein